MTESNIQLRREGSYELPEKLMIHVGYPKCASTYIQNQLLPSVNGIRLVTKQTHRNFYDAIASSEINFRPDEVFRRLPKSTLPLVISTEGFMGSPLGFDERSSNMPRRLKSLFPNAIINIVIRNQFEAIESIMLSWLQGGAVGGLGVNGFVKMAEYGGFNLEYYNYRKIIGFYRTLFGQDRVNVFLLEDLVATPSSFIRNSCRQSGRK